MEVLLHPHGEQHHPHRQCPHLGKFGLFKEQTGKHRPPSAMSAGPLTGAGGGGLAASSAGRTGGLGGGLAASLPSPSRGAGAGASASAPEE